MARIQLRDTDIYIQDGLAGTGAVNDTLADGETSMTIDTVVLNSDTTDLVPVGARFTVVGSTNTYTVTGRTPASAGPTTDITFTPALATADGIPADDAVITFLPQRIKVKIGDGDLSWTEAREIIFDRDRDLLDTTRLGEEQPVQLDLAFTFESVTTQSGQAITPVDAIKRTGEATEWVNSASDICSPYAVDLYVVHSLSCGTDEDQDFLFKEFYYESLEYSIQDATIAVSGQCNIADVVTTRGVDLG